MVDHMSAANMYFGILHLEGIESWQDADLGASNLYGMPSMGVT